MPGISLSIPDEIYLPLLEKAKERNKSLQDIIREILQKEFEDGDPKI